MNTFPFWNFVKNTHQFFLKNTNWHAALKRDNKIRILYFRRCLPSFFTQRVKVLLSFFEKWNEIKIQNACCRQAAHKSCNEEKKSCAFHAWRGNDWPKNIISPHTITIQSISKLSIYSNKQFPRPMELKTIKFFVTLLYFNEKNFFL